MTDDFQQSNTKKPKRHITALAIGCAYFQSKRYIKAANLLLKEGMPDFAAAKLILASEELAKVGVLGNLALEQVGKDQIDEIPGSILKKYNNHKSKLGLLISFMDSLINNKIKALKLEVSIFDGKEVQEIYQALSRVIKSGQLPKTLDEFKQKSMYTDMDGVEASCPLHNFDDSTVELVQYFTIQFGNAFKIIDTLAEKFLGPVYKSIEEYHDSKGRPDEEKKAELIRLIRRFWPAIRMLIDELYKTSYGIGMDEDPLYEQRKKEWIHSKNDEVKNSHLAYIMEHHHDLFTSKRVIGEKYFH